MKSHCHALHIWCIIHTLYAAYEDMSIEELGSTIIGLPDRPNLMQPLHITSCLLTPFGLILLQAPLRLWTLLALKLCRPIPLRLQELRQHSKMTQAIHFYKDAAQAGNSRPHHEGMVGMDVIHQPAHPPLVILRHRGRPQRRRQAWTRRRAPRCSSSDTHSRPRPDCDAKPALAYVHACSGRKCQIRRPFCSDLSPHRPR